MTEPQRTESEPGDRPTVLGPYRIVGDLKKGGMGVVYRGEHPKTGELVAIKTVRSPDVRKLAAIRREIQMLQRLCHPGIVHIIDEGVTEEGIPWYAMPLLQGSTLKQHLETLWGHRGETPWPAGVASGETEPMASPPEDGARHVPIPPAQGVDAPPLGPILTLIRRLCAPLAFLHGEGMVHRDLKPDNILIKDGRPVLLDLGIAARYGGAVGREELDVHDPIGTVGYMAPEQLKGELVDARADLYALGCILYECVTGRPPFCGNTDQIQRGHLDAPPSPPSNFVAHLPWALDALILKLLSKQPSQRLGYADDVAFALVAAGAEDELEDRRSPPACYLYRSEIQGRDNERNLLEHAVRKVVRERRGGLVLIRGESGSGKTRLAMDLAQFASILHARDQGRGDASPSCRIVHGGVPGAPAPVMPLAPLRPLLQEILDRARGQESAAMEWRLRHGRLLAAHGVDAGDGETDGAPSRLAALSPERAREELLASLRGALWALAERSPLLLVLDDMQWADEQSLSFLLSVANADLESRGVLLMATYRSEEERDELSALWGSPNVTRVSLERLDHPAVARMVQDMLGTEEPPPWHLVEELHRHSEGNPFFIAEYLRAAIAEGLLRRNEQGAWEQPDVMAEALSSIRLPHTLQELIERRFARLRPAARELLSWAAVLGRELDEHLLLTGTDVGEKESADFLRALRRLHILDEAQEGRLRFTHDKIREVAYAHIPEAERRALHRRAGEAIEAQLVGARTREMAATLAHHFARAGFSDKACRYFAQAADHARDAYAFHDAARFLNAAIEHRVGAPDTHVVLPEVAALHEALGDTLDPIRRQEEAKTAYLAALTATAPSLSVPLARLHRKIGKAWEKLGRHEEALLRYAQAESVLGERPGSGDDPRWEEWLEIQIARISVHYWLADVKRIEQSIKEIRPTVERHGSAVQRGRFLHTLTQRNVWNECYRPSKRTVGFARCCLAAFGDAAAAREAHWRVTARCSLAIILLLRDELPDAELEMVAALNDADRTGDVEMRARCLTYFTVIQRRRGKVEHVARLAEESLQITTDARMREYIGVAYANQAWVELRRGYVAEARRSTHEALECWAALARPYPFYWLAAMPLVSIELECGHLEGAISCVSSMLDARQQRLPSALWKALMKAREAADAANDAKVRDNLRRLLKVARARGYA